MRKIVVIIVLVFAAFGLAACSKKRSPNTIVVGTIAGPGNQLAEVAKQVAAKHYGLNVKLVTFSSYNIPNEALNSGEIDANVFQHIPFLDAQIKARGYKITPIGKTFIYPMGLYSNKIKSLSQLKSGSEVAIPNDPTNEGRALLLLQSAKLIQLKPNVKFSATPYDVASNPKHLKFIELGAAELPRALNDVALAAINTNFAIPAGLSPSKDALFVESRNSPYANVIVVQDKNKSNPKLLEFVKAYQSAPVVAEAKKLFGDAAIPAWKTKKN